MDRTTLTVIRIAALVALIGPTMAQNGTITTERPDQWRASKLVGVPIYGPGVTSIGKISDLLMGKDGTVKAVVIGIGGLLGIGEKDVALPYDQVQFSDQPITPQPAPASPTAQNTVKADGSTGTGSAPSAASDALAGGDRPMAPVASDVLGAPSHSVAYPDHGTVTMTIEQLRAAPSFRYAPSR